MHELLKKYHGTLIGAIFVIIWMIIYFTIAIFGSWGDPPSPGPAGFCEYFDPNLLVGEPLNSWSNFFYVGAGMIVLIFYDLLRDGKIKRKDVYIEKDENLHYLIAYGLMVTWIGIASFLMHAARRGRTGFLDVLSMNMYLSGVFVMSMAILFNLKRVVFYILLVLIFIIDFLVMETGIPVGGGDLFEFWVAFTFISEVILSLGVYSKLFKKIGARQIKRNTIVLVAVIGLFLFAYFLWHFGLRDSPTCDPYSLWQWHAVWHFLTACCTLLIAYYVLTEKEL